jgi:hypothetical protein
MSSAALFTTTVRCCRRFTPLKHMRRGEKRLGLTPWQL